MLNSHSFGLWSTVQVQHRDTKEVRKHAFKGSMAGHMVTDLLYKPIYSNYTHCFVHCTHICNSNKKTSNEIIFLFTIFLVQLHWLYLFLFSFFFSFFNLSIILTHLLFFLMNLIRQHFSSGGSKNTNLSKHTSTDVSLWNSQVWGQMKVKGRGRNSGKIDEQITPRVCTHTRTHTYVHKMHWVGWVKAGD